ncbi:MAG: hypothetical protein ACRC8S_11695 [Fimbriiglobus sp.]
MAMFVHLAPEAVVAKIRRNGIRRLRQPWSDFPGGVFAVPLTKHFYYSHQWLRELKRRGKAQFMAIDFRIPDDEQVWVGHYGDRHRWMTAAEAVAKFLYADDPSGWEVVIPRAISPSELHRVRDIPQLTGWRYSPTAKGKPPFCTCCIRGQYGAERLRERLGRVR